MITTMFPFKKASEHIDRIVTDQSKSKFNSRKFIYAVGITSCSTLALITNKASMKDWVDINKFLFASYVAGNVVQKS